MKVVFLGTRGEIEARTRRHRMHSSLLVSYRGTRLMIDCGPDWLGKFERLRPSGIVLTHAHPDHAWGLKTARRAPCMPRKRHGKHYNVVTSKIDILSKSVRRRKSLTSCWRRSRWSIRFWRPRSGTA